MEKTPYLSEIFRIVEGALRLDAEKVRNYTLLLADKLQQDGDGTAANRLRKMLEEKGHQLRPAKLESTATPVDGESRFPLLQKEEVPEEVGRHVFTESQREAIDEYLSVVSSRGALEAKGISAVANLLLYGPPGCGKTHLARYIAHELKLPLFSARLDGLVSSFLGSTAKNIRAVLEFASRTPCVLLLDEFDAIAKLRDDQQELGELKRIVNSFLQNLDALGSDVILIAATNHEQLLDPAVWRRFHYQLRLDLPKPEQREHFWYMFSGEITWSAKELKVLADLSYGFSVAAIETVMTRLRQRLIVNQQQPTLREALLALRSLAEGAKVENFPLVQAPLHDPTKLARQLKARDAQLYSLAMIGEVAGRSTATMSRLGVTAGPEVKRRGNGR